MYFLDDFDDADDPHRRDEQQRVDGDRAVHERADAPVGPGFGGVGHR